MQLEVVHPRENEVDIREGNEMKIRRVIQLCNFSDLPSKFISREIGQGRAGSSRISGMSKFSFWF